MTFELAFYQPDGQTDYVTDQHGNRVIDPMDGVLTNVTNLQITLETLPNRETYIQAQKAILASVAAENEEKKPALTPKNSSVVETSSKMYNQYSNHQRDLFITKMIESATERGIAAKVARSLGIEVREGQKWRKHYRETGGVPYKKSVDNQGRKKKITPEHDQFIRDLVDNDPQIFAEDIVDQLVQQFDNVSISKSHMNNYLKSELCMAIKKPIFESTDRNFPKNLQDRYDWYMVWKDTNIEFTENCIFIDEASFYINMRFNWARSEIGTQAMPTPSKKRKTNKGKEVKRAADEHDEQEQDNQVVDPEEEDLITDRKVSKGTNTLHFIKFINELLDVMDKDEKFQNSYLVFDNVNIHKYDPFCNRVGRKCILTEEHKKTVIDFIDANPAASVVEVTEHLLKRFNDLKISHSIVYNFMRSECNFSLKKADFHSIERNSPAKLEERYNWVCQWKNIDMNFLANRVFLDESAFDINMQRSRAWSKKGTSAIITRPTTRANTTSILGAISAAVLITVGVKKLRPAKKRKADGYISSGTVIGHYVSFLKMTLDEMDQHPHMKGHYIVIDNVPIHTHKNIKRYIEY
ncbi:hypothetical protein G6F46_009390 [Rhizopus delemar]|nr:hypothetical protein G6F46_009390 [Rhizopus delemar]